MPKIKIEMRQSDVTAVRSKLNLIQANLKADFAAGSTKNNALRASKELQNNITTQKFATDYPEYVDSYRDWKKAMGLSGKFWIRFGELFSAMTRWKESGRMNSWIAGIPDGIKNFKGDDIAGYAKIMEFGKKPRPLFVPTAKEMMPIATKHWIKSVNRIIRTIWR